ncbi:hypothetical protein BDZ45DRAFT_149524 [Acephala macrosclerotiorum]|nr:hypothetical protein BDZ45DRAFT_149524 [Acephala macrosclerotiorum]
MSCVVELPYLARDAVYENEKPYTTDFLVSGIPQAKATNHLITFQRTIIQDVREFGTTQFSLQENGFCFLHEPTCLTSETADETQCARKYYGEIKAILERHFPEYERVESLDHQVRRRSEAFPLKPGALTKAAQPASLPHSDFTTRGAFLRMRERFSGQERYFEDRDFDLLNVWRVLKGPNNDWPLAVCDYQSVDLESDAIENDVLHRDTVGENWLMFPNMAHRWYYMSRQGVDDLIVFRNADSRGRLANAFHAAFDLGVSGTEPRESIEIRFVGFRRARQGAWPSPPRTLP